MTTTQTFRMNQISEIIERLKFDHSKYTAVRDKYARVRSISAKLVVGGTLITTILAGSGIATTLSGAGVIVGVPMVIVAGCVSSIPICLGVLAKYLSSKISKHNKTIGLIESSQASMTILISESLSDGSIDTDEYSKIEHVFNEYTADRLKIRGDSMELKKINLS